MHIAVTVTLISVLVPAGLTLLGWILKSLSDLKADHRRMGSDVSSIKEDVKIIKERLMKS